MKHVFHLMAKPAGWRCNLACDYCFYLAKGLEVLRDTCGQRHMSDKVLETYVRQYIAASPGPEVNFTWQGGEPTLAGLDFYRRAVALQQRYAGGKRISNSLQTNGVLINDEWAAFLAQHRFLVGISLDGPAHLHNHYRKTGSGKPVFEQLMAALDTLNRYRVDVNILTVVNNVTAQAPLEIYRFLTREVGAEFLQFIPVVDYDPQHRLLPWSVTGEDYGRFMIAIFDEWVRYDVGRIFVQLFDNTLAAWLGERPALCVMQPTCGRGLVVEQNGDIYSCDHYVDAEHRLGNLLHQPLEKLVAAKAQRRFGQQKAQLPDICHHCLWRFACQGGCPKHRLNDRLNHLCAGYRMMFSHMDPYMAYMAQQIRLQQSPSSVMGAVNEIAVYASNAASRSG
ncbi:anaerobic sulfatase maturase [Enterobacter sp.]|uniref:anaerobic sulfatase maturase n=1 Tax=Enterobacter sp. TaxID=42895 RepID=UPI00296F6295|nr:anaerobic sulfatase maturase [Enterobacter sp.]